MRTPAPSALPFTAAGLRRGVVAALPFLLSNGFAGTVMGLAYRSLGLDFVSAVLFSLLVCSATAQAVTLGLWSASPPIAAMMLAVTATNSRYLVMSAHLRQLFADMPRRAMLPILALLADASWMMTIAEAERGRRDAGYLLGSSLPMNLGWIGGTALGYALPLKPQGPAGRGGRLPAAGLRRHPPAHAMARPAEPPALDRFRRRGGGRGIHPGAELGDAAGRRRRHAGQRLAG